MRRTTFINMGSVIVGLMTAITAGYSIYHPEVYSLKEPGQLNLIVNQDLAILAIFVPLLLASTWLAVKGHFRGTLIWLGTVGYLGYVFSGYSFAGISQKLLLLHMAITALSFFLLFTKLATIDPEAIRLRFIPVTPFRFTAFFMVAIGLLIESLWLQKSIPFSSLRSLGVSVIDFQNILAYQVLDLAFLGPLCILAGIWLYFRKAVGYVSTPGLLVIIPAKFGTLVTGFNRILEDQTNLAVAILTLAALVILISFLKKLKEEKLTSYHDRISPGL